MADYPAIRLDNRVWLPVLQIHIWLLHLFHAPYYSFKLIPCFYYFASIVFLGMLSFNQTGRTRSSLIFSLVLALLFARQKMVLGLSVSLMQEIIGLALFFLLLQFGALELKKKWWLSLTVVVALLTRDSFWIYLFAVSLLNWKKILSDRTYVYSFLALWSVPVFWMLMVPVGHLLADGRLPDFPTEWPLGINKIDDRAVSNLTTSLSSLWESLIRTKVIYFAASLFVLWVVLLVFRATKGKMSSPANDFYSRFKPFSLLSLGIVYTLIILFDPWQITFGAGRMSMPLLSHSFIWAIILFRQASVSHRGIKYVAMILIVSGLTLSTKMDIRARDPQYFAQVKQVYEEIEYDLRNVSQDSEFCVCIIDENYFGGLSRLLPPTLYMKRRMILQSKNASLRNCDVLFTPTDSKHIPVEGFTKHKDYHLDGFAYTLFLAQEEH